MEIKPWPEMWQELQTKLRKLPPCPEHHQYPCVRTLAQGVVNDIVDVSSKGVKVRSHRTEATDSIKKSIFERWWNHLVAEGSASLRPGDSNNPDAYRSRIVGAILAACLPDKIRVDDDNATIRLV